MAKFLSFSAADYKMEAATADIFWLSDEQWAAIEPFMSKNQPEAERRSASHLAARSCGSGILHVLT